VSAVTKIELTPEAEKILADVKTMPEWMGPAVASGMDQANTIVVSRIRSDHLTGRGPFPPEEHRLGARTNRLRGAVWASPATVSGDTVQSAIGDNVKYAAIHEFGGVIHHAARKGTVRLRTNKHTLGGSEGELLRQEGHPHLAVFAKASHKNVKEVAFEAGEHDVMMPERAPFRTGIQENLAVYGRLVGQAVQAAWEQHGT
jgi:phage gpG-like protein